MAQAVQSVSASQSGSAYASDVNDALLAVQTNHSGGTAPSYQQALQLWADTSTNLMKLRNSANTGYIDLFPLNSSLSVWVNTLFGTFGLGLDTLPLKLGNDLNTVDKSGLYRINSGTLNNPYGSGFVLVAGRGSGDYDQFIYSYTNSIIYMRTTLNSGSLWTVRQTIQSRDTLLKCKFSGTSSANLTGTYSQTGTTVTVTATAHGHSVGHVIYADCTTGAGVDGTYTIATVTDANTFTYTAGTSQTTSGNVTLQRRQIFSSAGIQSVTYVETGVYYVNLSTPQDDNNYTVNISMGGVAGSWASTPHVHQAQSTNVSPTVNAFVFTQLNAGTSGYLNAGHYSILIN